eukprot:6251155-Prymnesium_polylepis.1
MSDSAPRLAPCGTESHTPSVPPVTRAGRDTGWEAVGGEDVDHQGAPTWNVYAPPRNAILADAELSLHNGTVVSSHDSGGRRRLQRL